MNARPRSPAEVLARRHREMLVVSVLVVVLSFVLRVRPDERVQVGAASWLTLPPTCASNELFHVRCPGCGLTRSFLCVARGDCAASWRYHRVGWLLALVVVLQLPYRLLALRRADRDLLGPRLRRLIPYLLIALLLGNWLFDLVMLRARAG